jgi:hypothetical protein
LRHSRFGPDALDIDLVRQHDTARVQRGIAFNVRQNLPGALLQRHAEFGTAFQRSIGTAHPHSYGSPFAAFLICAASFALSYHRTG